MKKHATPSQSDKHPVVHIIFLDHVSASADAIKPFRCEVFGVLSHQDKDAYYVTSWISESSLNDSNSDSYCILKGTVLEFNWLKKGGRYANYEDAARYSAHQTTPPVDSK